MSELKRILVLDDDSDYRKLVMLHLSKLFKGVKVDEYDPLESGPPADDFDWSPYDVLVIDYFLCLHGITGLDILQKNKQRKDFPAAILLTGAGNQELAVKVAGSGLCSYLKKENLSKELLKSTVIDAFEKNKELRLKIFERTNQGRAFNKSLFYQNLENPYPDGLESKDKSLILIQLDAVEEIEKNFGVLIRDSITRHVAKTAFVVFNLIKSNPSITPLSESSVALLIEEPEKNVPIKNYLAKLCHILKNNQYKYGDQEFQYTVSIGVIVLSREPISAQKLVNLVDHGVEEAGKIPGNTVNILNESGDAITYSVAEKKIKDTNQLIPELVLAKSPANDEKINQSNKVSEEEVDKSVSDPDTKPGLNDTQNIPADENLLEEASLDETGQQTKLAFDEKRITQTFIPLLSFIDDGATTEFYSLSTNKIDKEGGILTYSEFEKDFNTPELKQYLDRWMLRKAFGQIINHEDENYFFIIRLSADSIADANLFNWMRKTLTGIGDKHPGNSIAIELQVEDLKVREKQVNALITYLHKSHGFKFVLAGISNIEDILNITEKTHFDLVKLTSKMIEALRDKSDEESGSKLQKIKSTGIKLIATDIDDALILTEAINTGADFAMGDFVGGEIQELDELTQMESLEIT